ncbi:ABC transporter ATP-binding protein [Brevibacillus agri]|uniref:ABC transporter ATP-binding protein n=1 Tax=Brevibacillus agri TaxID=51101 RepID=A0A3M8BBT6_9BACL|nr:ABC transporter ATP-binding protein [Brevibacillus agri]MBG9564856.1 ABC transporter ATP-binding protein [Brevibacillus agri]QAV13983.1 ABC transporter ATP-binding protein [Brevibacillus agri]RNB60856.1 ABC transporter ATP-binding protein [Brevibacillus agri]GED24480.1 ABC transporter ATP-binding protein [Brevibacillus agri]
MFIQKLGQELLQLLSLMKAKKRAYFLGLLGDGIGQASVLVALPFVFKDLTDFAHTKDPALLTRAIVTIAAMFLLFSLLSPFFSYIYRRCVRELIADIRLLVFQRLSRLPFAYYEQHHSGDTMSRLGNDVQLMERAYGEQLKTLCIILLSLIGSIIGMFALDGKIATVLLLVSTLTLYVNAQFAKSVRRIGDQLQQQLGIGTERLSDFLAGLPVVKMFHLHNVVTARYTKANEEVASSAIKQGHKHALLEGTNFFIQFVSFGGMLVVGIMLVAKQMIGLGVLVAMIQQQMLVTLAFLQLGHVITTLQGSLAGASRIVGFLQEPLEPDQYPLRFAHADDSDSMLKMEQVVFGYTADTKVLDGVSLHIGRGQMAALVGTSGGGKSTVMKLLLGYYPPAAGSLFLMGKPLGQYSIAELRSLVAYVPQDAFLFEGTIAENIRYGCQDATEEDVVRACKAAYAHDFILELPDGYQTRTGERGAKLSGGQRQRIAIARAILKNAPILLLDEATSALDAESEYWVQQALAALMQEKTVLVIAHRLSTVEHADIIYVLHEGKVVEQGRHAELLAQNGLYASMYEVQQRKDLPAREWSQSSAGLA